ncbi:outer membrane beta-barrel family protein [Pedobacter montanisoli]|uniref:Outer membrane beta-barrel protein n=1 Tax=Pedobacter montanisoli TaxID=2923277 RepID=A0ABS9ZSI4_9SPHI|nr:outer membrane beta-barrel family protein [Pedobacter montanisoli]MCJ0741453.1 outer membrane beta-barrel protein [Pedobacter montanisoli]
MKNKFLQTSMIFILTLTTFFAYAQNKGSVSGKVVNAKDKSPVDYASVAVKKISDSTTVGGTNSGSNGSFTISNLAAGKYRLYVAFIGLKTATKDFEITASKTSVNVGEISMENTGVNLNTVEVKAEIPPVVVKKDTLEISASTLKVKENAVVEDLLKKVPGVEVSKDGTVTTQGETIKKVRVDGKDFMGNDPLLATRNLAADMVDKIQIIDDMSEQSKFSGVDDGNREKIINIVTKNGVKNKGYVGNNSVGYGTDDRYDVNLSISRFDKAQQLTLIGQFNNVNKQNFGGGVGGGGGGMRGMMGGMGGGAQQQGITTTNAAGFNFADTYDDGTQISGSYFFNKTQLDLNTNSFTQNFIGGNTTTNRNETESLTKRLNHRLNFMVDTKIDSSTSIRVQPSLSYTDNTAQSLQNYTRTTLAGTSVGKQIQNSNTTTPSFSNSILIRKKFVRRGRTLSLNINTNINDSDADNYVNNPETLTPVTGPIEQKGFNQLNDNSTSSLSNTARLVYTEPLSKTLSLEFNYQNGYTRDNKKRFVYDFNNATGQYDLKNIDYSNEFQNTTLTNALGFSFNGNEKKYNWNVGLAVQRTNRENDNLSTGREFKQNFTNLTPSAQFRYNFSNSKRLFIRYDGRTNQPSIDQIQPIRDNTNTQSFPVGNPDLKPSFANNLRIMYNNFDFASYRTLFLGAFITQTFNDFGNSQRVITDLSSPDAGKIENKYVNVDGNFNGSVFGTLGLPIIKGNKLNLQINAGGSYGQNTSFTTDKNDITTKNITTSYSLNNGYKLVSNLDKLDLIAGISGRMDRSTVTSGNNTRYYTLAPNIDISYVFPGNIRLQTDVTYNKLTGGGTANSNPDYTLWNAYISRQFFKNRGTFKFAVNDLLDQNTGVLRNASANSISEQNFNVLKRYYMLSFTYSLSNIAGTQGRGQQGQGNFRMGGPGRF